MNFKKIDQKFFLLSFIFLILVFYFDSILWLIKYYFNSSENIFGIAMLSGVAFLVWNIFKRKRVELKFEKFVIFILLMLMLFEIINSIYFRNSFISITLLCFSISIFAYGFIKNMESREIALLSFLLILSMPFIYFVNLTFGHLVRKIFAISMMPIIKVFENSTTLIDTIILSKNRYINIDSQCSGVFSVYLISYFSGFVSIYFKYSIRQFFILIVSSLAFFFLFNWIHVLLVVFFHNITGIEDIRSFHLISAFFVFLFSIFFSFLLQLKFRKI